MVKSKVTVIDNSFYRAEQHKSEIKHRHTQIKRNNRRIRQICVAFAFLMGVYVIYNWFKSNGETAVLNEQTVRATRKFNNEKAKNRELNLQISQLKDKEYVEKIIRDKYGYSKKGETVYIFPDENTK